MVFRRDLLGEVAEQVELSGAVQRQARLVEEQDDTAVFLSDLRELHEKGEKPDEAFGALGEWHRDAVQAVLDARPRDWAAVERSRIAGLALREDDLDLQLVVLGPVLENLIGDAQGGGLALGVQLLEMVGRGEVFQRRAGVLEEVEEHAVAAPHLGAVASILR